MAGYSANPLWKKLGYRAGQQAVVENAPPNYLQLLQLPPEIGVEWITARKSGMEFVHLFATGAAALEKRIIQLRKQIADDGVVWISWPKKSSGAPTDITEDTIRRVALPLGFVDIKVCAVDETWSGLKLMIRRSER